MSTIKESLENIKVLKNDLVDNINEIGLNANYNETFNSLVPKLYMKTSDNNDDVYLPWFNLTGDLEGKAQEILDKTFFSKQPTNFSNWLEGLKDSQLELDIGKYIDTSLSPKLNYTCRGIKCKKLIFKDMDFTGITPIYFPYNTAVIDTFYIKNCKFGKLYLYDTFPFNCDGAAGNVNIKHFHLEDVEVVGTTNGNIGCLWGYGRSTGLETFYIKNVSVLINPALRYLGNSKLTLKSFYCENLTVGSKDTYDGFDEFIYGDKALETLTLKNCVINDVFRASPNNSETVAYVGSPVLKEVIMTDNVLDNSISSDAGHQFSALCPIGEVYHSFPGDNGWTRRALKSLEKIDLSNWTGNITNLNYLGRFCYTADDENDYTLIDFKMDNWDVSNVTSILHFCHNLGFVKNLDTLKTLKGIAPLTNCEYAFSQLHISPYNYYSKTTNNAQCTIEEIDLSHFDFHNCTSLLGFMCQLYDAYNSSGYKYGNNFLKRIIGTIDCSNVMKTMDLNSSNKGRWRAFVQLYALEEMPPLINLGKGIDTSYTEQTCPIYLHKSPNLTHETVLNIINNLYDLNLTYNTAEGGTLISQSLVLHNDVKTQLTPEEIAIATNKGWTIA